MFLMLGKHNIFVELSIDSLNYEDIFLEKRYFELKHAITYPKKLHTPTKLYCNLLINLII